MANFPRTALPEFETANPLYIGASVTFYTVDVSGVKTTTLAPLYADTTGTDQLENPQILDSFGKFTAPVYIDAPVIGSILSPDAAIPAHNTGIITTPGSFRGVYNTTPGTIYYSNDLIQDPATGYVYAAIQPFLSTTLAADIADGNLVIFLTPADLMAAIHAAAEAAAADASATAAAGSAAAAFVSQTAAAASSTASATSATGSAASAASAVSSAAAAAASAVTAAASSQIQPQGRLSLSATLPVMNADIISVSTLYYLPYRGQNVPVYNGASFANLLIGAGVSMALDNNSGHTGYHQGGTVYDIFMFNAAGTPTLATGPAWSSATARGTGAGTTEIQRLNGLWVNKNAINLKANATATLTNVAANQATYLGSFVPSGDGTATVLFKPAAVAGGGNNGLLLYNAYNRITTFSELSDSTASWTYATATWRASNNSGSNKINFVDGLQESFIRASMVQAVQVGTEVEIGINLDSASATPTYYAYVSSNINAMLAAIEAFPPQLGVHYAQAMENSPSGSNIFKGAPPMVLRLEMEM